jgi:hypothetical protein
MRREPRCERAGCAARLAFFAGGAAIYLENGAEFANRIVGNMITCEYMSARTGGIDGSGHCSLLDGYPEQIDSDFNEQSGIYMLSSFNDVVGNRVSGQDNAL